METGSVKSYALCLQLVLDLSSEAFWGTFRQREAVEIGIGVEAYPKAVERSFGSKDEHHETGQLVAGVAKTIRHRAEVDRRRRRSRFGMRVPLSDEVQARPKLLIDYPLLVTELRKERGSASSVGCGRFGSTNNPYQVGFDSCQQHAPGFRSGPACLAKPFDCRECLRLYSENLCTASCAQFDSVCCYS